jgi:Bax protein
MLFNQSEATMRYPNSIIVVGTIIGLSIGTASVAADEEIHIKSYERVLELFEDLEYTPETWQAGIRSVPRVYLSNVPERWRGKVSKEIPVLLKKQLFFRLLAPLALRSNELILKDRERLLALQESSATDGEDAAWLKELAIQYGVIDKDGGKLNVDTRAELLKRVDIVPVSLALAQAAEESGWGTSRFADQGNAIFGQWTWGEHGILPKEQRAGLGNYKIAAFDSPLGSIRSYMHNLNTNRAYKELRERRSAQRDAGEDVLGWDLAEGLTSYSERGEEYVKSLHAIMRVNKLAPADTAFLKDGPVVTLRPVGEGAE